jgi:tRNA pseudouridine13 synthase
MSLDLGASPPLLTADLPGIGGRIKQHPEDFDVEEIPAYEPSGQGDHLYLWVEKRGMGAEYFVRQIARRLGIKISDVGTAGLKDRHAVTRQMVSVPDLGADDRLAQLEGEGIRLLRVSRHTNKLRAGHLRGNRFRILIRDVLPEQSTHLDALVARLQQQGLPNYYGEQRFGREGETLRLGLALLRGEKPPGPIGGNPFLRKLALSAAQSALFNAYLGQRLSDGLSHQVLEGDVMAKRPFGGLFVATEVGREQLRFDSRETVHTGPIFGRKMFAPGANAAARETAVLEAADLSVSAFTHFGKLLQGTRRPNLVYVDDLLAKHEPEGIWLNFTLPAGSYATVLLREIMKNETGASCEDESAVRDDRS